MHHLSLWRWLSLFTILHVGWFPRELDPWPVATIFGWQDTCQLRHDKAFSKSQIMLSFSISTFFSNIYIHKNYTKRISNKSLINIFCFHSYDCCKPLFESSTNRAKWTHPSVLLMAFHCRPTATMLNITAILGRYSLNDLKLFKSKNIPILFSILRHTHINNLNSFLLNRRRR